jgi:hypothetical protein
MSLGRLVFAVVSVAAVGFVGGGCAATERSDSDGVGWDRLPSSSGYEQAVEETRRCMTDKGYVVSDAVVTTGGIIRSFSWDAKNGVEKAYEDCYGDHLKVIEHLWFHSNVPTGEAWDSMFIQFTECLANVGISGVRPDFSVEEVMNEFYSETNGDDDPGLGEALLCLEDYRLLYPDGLFPL